MEQPVNVDPELFGMSIQQLYEHPLPINIGPEALNANPQPPNANQQPVNLELQPANFNQINPQAPSVNPQPLNMEPQPANFNPQWQQPNFDHQPPNLEPQPLQPLVEVQQDRADRLPRLDEMLSEVAGTDLHETYWKIVDHIYYFVRNALWDAIPQQAPLRRNVQPPPIIPPTTNPDPPTWEVYINSILAKPMDRFSPIFWENLQFASDAYSWVRIMAKLGALEQAIANLAQTRPGISELGAKLAAHEKAGVQWDASKHGHVDQTIDELDLKNEVVFLAVDEWGRRYRTCQLRQQHGFSQQRVADIPKQPAEETESVLQLMDAAVDEGDMIEDDQTSRGSYIIKKKSHMSLLNLQIMGWEELRGSRAVHLVSPHISPFCLDFGFKAYDTFMARFEDVKHLFTRSKAVITNMVKCPIVFRFAGKPHVELSTKVTNDGTNTRRQGRIAFAAAAMARQERQEAARKAKLQAKLVAWREERALLPPPFLKRKRDEGDRGPKISTPAEV
ncbi:hypothetical protein B0H65DRAFT_551579 [Neurospora tetraspora]|uniref:Uncharacterized protein n=1 Tax=Neurospora tetraspora TaxID=94610 RepID=A0AAE0J9G9_9PEZI|nr:hypothetical protein B0H65DRAFT_551579 [Neurospora tetraspora]